MASPQLSHRIEQIQIDDTVYNAFTVLHARVGPLFMKYPISDQISDFLDIRIRFSAFPIRTEPNPTVCYPTISVFDFLISAHLLLLTLQE